MDRIRIISGIFQKQIKELIKNKEILMLFFVYPIIALIMTSAISGEFGFGSEIFFVSVFSVMHCIFTPIVATATIISEEKEKNTLRTLIMSNVKPTDYLISVGGFIYIVTMITGLLFLPAADFTAEGIIKFILSMSVGCICSIVLGLSIGGHSKNMTGANAMAVPFGMVFAFLPMLATFNEKIAEISRFTYGYQISNIISSDSFNLSFKDISIILINLIIFVIAFILVFRKNKLED